MRKAPIGQEDHVTRLAESSTREVGVQVPCGSAAKVPSENSLRKDQETDWGNPATVVPGKGYRVAGRPRDAGPHPHAGVGSTEVQHREYDRVPEGEERCSDPPGDLASKRDVVWSGILGHGILREYRRVGGIRGQAVHTGPGKVSANSGSTTTRS